jgi:hypothetical protein
VIGGNRNKASSRHGPITRLLYKVHLDAPLLAGICAVLTLSLMILYSASGSDIDTVYRQCARIGIAQRRGFTPSALSPWRWWILPAKWAAARSAGWISACAFSRRKS